MSFTQTLTPSPAHNPTSFLPFLQTSIRLNVLPQRGIQLRVNSSVVSANYKILAQHRDTVLIPENSPSISMWPYLQDSLQTIRLNTISVYVARGDSREQTRLLYMNAAALSVWREMGMSVTIIGETNRPPRTAALCFGMPFSE